MYSNVAATAAQQAGAFLGQGLQNAVRPSEPSIATRADELQGHIADLESLVNNLRHELFGEGEPSPALQQPPPNSVEFLLADATSRVANLCGQMRTINTRVCRSTK